MHMNCHTSSAGKFCLNGYPLRATASPASIVQNFTYFFLQRHRLGNRREMNIQIMLIIKIRLISSSDNLWDEIIARKTQRPWLSHLAREETMLGIW